MGFPPPTASKGSMQTKCLFLTTMAAIALVLPCHVASFTLPSYHPASCKPLSTRPQQRVRPPSVLYYSESETTKESSSSSVETIDNRVQGRNNEAARLKVRLEQLKQDTKMAQSRADAYDRRVDLLRKQLIDMGEELEEEDRRVQDSGEDVVNGTEEDEEDEEEDDEDDDDDDVDQEKLTLMDRVRYLTTTLEQQKEEFDKKSMQEAMTSAQRRRLLKDEIDNLRDELVQAEKSAGEKLEREKTSLMDQLKALTNTMTEQKNVFDKKLQEKDDKLTKRQKELQGQIGKLEKELVQAKQQAGDFKQITADLKGERSELEWRLRRTLESAKNDIYELDRKLEQSEEMREKEAKEAEETLEKTKKDYTQQLKAMKEAAEKQVAEMERDFAEELENTKLAAANDLEEIKRDRERTWEVKNDVIKRYRTALSILQTHFNEATASAKSNLDSVKSEMEIKLNDLAKKSRKEKAKLMKEKEEAVADLDDKIDRLTEANSVLSSHLKERKEYYESELKSVKADMTKRLVHEKTRSAMEKERILRETALIIAGKDRLINEYEAELTSFRKLAKQALSVGKTRFRRLVRRRRKKEGKSDR